MRLFTFLVFTVIFINEGYTQESESSPQLQAAIDSMSKYLDAGEYIESEDWLEEARKLLGSKPNNADYFRLRYNEGILHLQKREIDIAEPILMECLENARKRADTTQLVAANAVMGHLKAEQGLYGSSVIYTKEALSYLRSTDSLRYYALTSNISISYRHLRKTERSLQYAISAKEFYEREKLYLELALSLNNIGELYREQFEDYPMAEKHYRQAIMINKNQGFKGALSANYLNLALTFDALQETDSALYYINLAKNVRSEIGDVGGLAIVFNAMGDINLHSGNNEAAKKAFLETIRISKEHQIYPGLFYGNRGLGDTYFALGANSVSKRYFEKALKIARDLDSQTMIADSFKSLYELEREIGNYKSALSHFEAYNAYSDSIRMKEQENEFAELKTVYETDMAHKENMLLKANQSSQKAELKRQRILTIGLWVVLAFVLIITLILFIGYKRRSKSLKKEAALRQELQAQYHTVQTQKEELKDLNDLKNKIFSVLGHDLKAPLTSISSLINLMNTGDVEPEELAIVTAHLDQETKAGLISLQNILVWSQAKTGSGKPEKEDISVSSVVDEFLKNSERQIKNKELQVSSFWDNARIIHADQNQFKSIALNLISNAIKFSPKGGKITLKTIKASNGTYFTVRNEGEAISEELISKINSSHKIVSKRGTQGEKGTGIGLRLVSDFAKLHGGYLKFREVETGGTEAEVFFPDEKANLKASA